MKKLLFVAMSIGFANFAVANEIELEKEVAVALEEEAVAKVCCHEEAASHVRKLQLDKFMTATQAENKYQTFYAGCVTGGGNGSFYCN